MHTVFASFEVLFLKNHLLGYLSLYFSTIFLGNIAAFSAFWLALRGVFGFFGVFWVAIVILFAEITSDVFWYGVGRLLSHTKLGDAIRGKFSFLTRLDGYLEKKGKQTIFFAKFLYGLSYPVMFSAGWARLPFKLFFTAAVVASCFWLPVIFSLSYFLTSSLTYFGASLAFARIEKLFFLGITLFLLLQFFLARIIKKFFRPKDI